ncbi:uncharacterized protein TNCV_3015691 [Trichonephila clavipes]|nr:uncharacterized protein TNCV_3015691 [Trichonephila clavipes]
MASIEQCHSRRSMAPETYTVKRELLSPLTDCTTVTVIQLGGQVFDEGHGESGVLHSAKWHDGDWMVDGVREAWLRCFVWMVNFEKFFDLAESLLTAL